MFHRSLEAGSLAAGKAGGRGLGAFRYRLRSLLTFGAICLATFGLATDASALFPREAKVWGTPNIPVCWENPDPADGQKRQWVQEAVYEYWSAWSSVRLIGWMPCTQDSPGLRIIVEDTRSHVARLGIGLAGTRNGISLNFVFMAFNPVCQTKLEQCIKFTSAHEFGHALGFSHEQNRPDRPPECTDAPQGENGDMMLGRFDPKSIMNYCNDSNYTWPLPFSQGDRDGVQRYFLFVPGFGRALSYHGLCMGMRGDPAQDVLPIQTEFCKNSLSDGARWYFDPARERMVNRRTGKVLRWNAAIGSMDAGPDTPSNYDAFWSMPEAEIRHQTGKCLDVQNGRTDDGAPVWLWDCHGGPPQRWTMMPDGTIRTPANMCLDGGGGQMTIRNCGSVPQQRWRLSDGWLSMPEMAPGSGQGLCASVPAYTFPPNGANITFDTACGGRGQRTTEFFLHGLIRNRLNLKCVVPPDSVDTPVGVDDCLDWESQKWDVYM